jgi:uncharacterized membrane protein
VDWLYLAITSLIAASFLGILRKILIKNDTNTLDSVILFQFVSAFFLSFLFIFNDFSFPSISTYPINYLITGVFWGGSMVLLFNAYKLLEASEIAILATTEIVLVLFLGKMILNELITFPMIMGVILIILSIIIISINRNKSYKFNKGYLYVTGAAILAAFADINDVYLLRNTGPLSYIFIALILPGIFVYSIKILKQRTFKIDLQKLDLKILVILSFAAVIATLPFYFAIVNEGQISQVLPIYKTSIIFTVLLSSIILKERKNLSKKLFSAILAVLGVILIGM